MKTGCAFVVFAIAAFAVKLLGFGSSDAQETEEPRKIFVGQSLDEAVDVLERSGIAHGQGGFAFAMVDPDQTNIWAGLDINHCTAAIFYSKSKSKITGIQLFYFPGRKLRRKTNESMVQATEVVLHQDRSYSVHFSTPLTEEQLLQQEKLQAVRASVPAKMPPLPPSKFTPKSKLSP